MPGISINGATLNYQDTGQGPEVILFAHGLLMSHKMFNQQIQALKEHYRCIALDFRGQGQSEVSAAGYDMDTLTADVVEMIRQLDLAPCHFAGLSMGGFVGLRLGIHHPDLLKSLILINTSAESEPKENLPKYSMLNFIARWFGLGLVISKVMPIMFGSEFLKDVDRRDKRDEWKKNIAGNHRIGITRAVKGVINREGVAHLIDKITVPTLIVTGEADTATIPAKSQQMKDLIPNSRLVSIPKSGHSSTIEEPEAVTTAMREFLNNISLPIQ